MEFLTFRKQEDGVGILEVNRPEALNALNSSVLLEMEQFLSSPPSIRALILTGSGDKAFIAGADIKEMLSLDSGGMVKFCELGQRVSLLLETAPFVTLAAVNGFALGGGLEMVLACDFAYAATSAQVGLPEVSLGIIPGFGGTQRLARCVGTRMAKELVMSGRRIGAEEALRLGIVNKVCESSELLTSCEARLRSILQNSFQAVMHAKTAINSGVSLGIHEALDLERALCGVSFGHPDRQEGMQAFVEKREVVFQ